jgi:hypothetical protein
VREILRTLYSNRPDGQCGNVDCGQMSAWYILSAAGFYPVTPGSPVYAIGTPLFPEMKFHLENGRSFIVKANNVSKRNFYIQSAKLNGRPYGKTFINHSDLMAGGELVFEMGDEPNRSWGREAPVSEITTQRIVAVPVVEASAKTFTDRMRVGFRSDRNTSIYYTVDGRTPDKTSTRFSAPFFIDKTSTVKYRAFADGGQSSQVGLANFLKLQHNWKLTLLSKYSSQYPGGGDQALIDGIRGTTNFNNVAWQGYEGNDLIAIVDLGQIQSVTKLGAGFLQDVDSWILMPTVVSFEVSIDGKSFVPVLSIPNDISPQNHQATIKDFTGTMAPRNARYVKMRAQNFGKLPAWHPGAGGDAWIFADEIIIE